MCTGDAGIGDAKLSLKALADELAKRTGGAKKNQAVLDEIRGARDAFQAKFRPLMESDETPLNPYRVIGDLMIRLGSRRNAQLEVGWVVHPAFQGRGLAAEGASALLDLAFGRLAERIPGSSTKSMIGHPQGASGAAGVAATALALAHGFLPPTINLDHPDPECDLDFLPNRGRQAAPAAALCNCLGFGSKNSALVLGRV